MAKHLTLKVLGSQTAVEKKNISSILAPGLAGDVEVRPDHATMIMGLRSGTVKLLPSNETIEISHSGLLKVHQNHCILSLIEQSVSDDVDENQDAKSLSQIFSEGFFS
ncbi:MAG: hypothetical protein C0582_05625 [Alphaproteobacteria bacterium]|nr:MAG: hypothetical protein C0582_05625 [Alphaproteobacteria bacterium]